MKNSMTQTASIAILALACGATFASNVVPLKPSQTQVNPGTVAGIPQLAQLPDLIPVISTAGAAPKFGVQNIGKVASTPSVLSVQCQKQTPVLGSCPMNNSNDPMVESSNATLNVPAVNVGETKWFGLSDFPGASPAGSWGQGGYSFKVSVDVKNQVNESNENNNTTQGSHIWNK